MIIGNLSILIHVACGVVIEIERLRVRSVVKRIITNAESNNESNSEVAMGRLNLREMLCGYEL